MKIPPTLGNAFAKRKQAILSQLSVPEDEYTDASPKGSVDAGIRHLIDQINAHAGLVTTSSCAGRVSVYLEGKKATTASAGASVDDEGVGGGDGDGDGRRAAVLASGSGSDAAAAAASSAGGKGGGEWLFVSHDPVKGDVGAVGYDALLGLRRISSENEEAGNAELSGSSRLIHFKFEPMILHVLTASLEHAQLVIQAGMEAGFRETGAVSLLKRQADGEATPIVAVRSMGLSFESLIGAETDGTRRLIVSPQHLKTLVRIANERFVENQKRIARFSTAIDAAFAPPKAKAGWEDAQARRERKRQEGLKRREELRNNNKPVDESSLDQMLQQEDVM